MRHTFRLALPKQPTCLVILVGIELLSLSYADADELDQLDIEAFLQDHHHVDLTTLDIVSMFSVYLPFASGIQLTSVRASLIGSVAVTFGVTALLAGKARFYHKNQCVTAKVSACNTRLDSA